MKMIITYSKHIFRDIEKTLLFRTLARSRKGKDNAFDRLLKKRFHAKLESSQLFKLFHIIPISMSSHPLIAMLLEGGEFNFDDGRNTLMLPLDYKLANRMGISVYSDDPIAGYMDGLTGKLYEIWNSPAAAAARAGDISAREEVCEGTYQLAGIMRIGLINGDLLADYRQ